ncbi:MAG: protein TolR [Alphaproteobacteria bacterium]
MAGALLSRSKGKNFRYNKMSDINVTPFVDVMLVLLIVFMVAAPLLTVGVEIELPETSAPPINQQVEPLEITVSKDGRIFLQESETALDALVPRLEAITNQNPDTQIYVRGDKTIDYGRVLEVMGLVTHAGFRKIALISAPGDAGAINTLKSRPATPTAAMGRPVPTPTTSAPTVTGVPPSTTSIPLPPAPPGQSSAR